MLKVMPELKFWNTLTKEKQSLVKPSDTSLDQNVYTFYSCGPTVYGFLHVGNARALFTADLIFRALKFWNYPVRFVRNYTDIDDKILQVALRESVTSLEVAERYIRECEIDCSALNLLEPTRKVRVTETLTEIIALIQKIIDQGYGYVEQGDVLFSVRKFQAYGQLSGRVLDDLQSGARIQGHEYKKDPLDFVLWKAAKPGEPSWDSPWGAGRPGWHIECSAMAWRWLGETIDLHHGGLDLMFPHHENEIAQSEAAHGKPFCKHWVHNAFITMNAEKMSKSQGNIVTIREFCKNYSPEILKYIFLKHHYRSPVDLSEQLILDSMQELERIYKAKAWCQEMVAQDHQPASKKENVQTSSEIQEFLRELASDLNTPGALAVLFKLIREINAHGAASQLDAEQWGRAMVLNQLFDLCSQILNMGELDPKEALAQFELIRSRMKGVQLSDDEIKRYIEERKQARINKDFKKSDEIRKYLQDQNIELLDTPQGTTWKVSR